MTLSACAVAASPSHRLDTAANDLGRPIHLVRTTFRADPSESRLSVWPRHRSIA
jgi:hypothetical protein